MKDSRNLIHFLLFIEEKLKTTTFYKLKCGSYNVPVDNYFEFCADKRLRSYSSNKLELNVYRTDLFKATFFNRIPYLWNNLPDNIRISHLGISSFKKQREDYYKDIGFDPDNPRATWVS